VLFLLLRAEPEFWIFAILNIYPCGLNYQYVGYLNLKSEKAKNQKKNNFRRYFEKKI